MAAASSRQLRRPSHRHGRFHDPFRRTHLRTRSHALSCPWPRRCTCRVAKLGSFHRLRSGMSQLCAVHWAFGQRHGSIFVRHRPLSVDAHPCLPPGRPWPRARSTCAPSRHVDRSCVDRGEGRRMETILSRTILIPPRSRDRLDGSDGIPLPASFDTQGVNGHVSDASIATDGASPCCSREENPDEHRGSSQKHRRGRWRSRRRHAPRARPMGPWT